MTLITVELDAPDDLDGWKRSAAALDCAGVSEDRIRWRLRDEVDNDLFGGAVPVPSPVQRVQTIRADFGSLCDQLLLHQSGNRFALAYRLYRRLRNEPDLLKRLHDPDVSMAQQMIRAVRREIHEMHAFVRFRQVLQDSGESVYIAWFEPEHYVARAAAPFFARRFSTMPWSILTPYLCVHWQADKLHFAQGVGRDEAPDDDALEELWRVYYSSIFNPARLNIKAMKAEMPVRYWKNLPEARAISSLVKASGSRVQTYLNSEAPDDESTIKARWQVAEKSECATTPTTLEDLALAQQSCRRCPLHCAATQVVSGEGPAHAQLMIVGEQPGDREDLEGRPFRGPAGQVFDAACQRTGLERKDVYVTNAVKHFKFEPRGKRRIHKTPNAREIDHCRFWLDLERRILKPKLILALGSTAVRALSGRAVTLGDIRGQAIFLGDAYMLATVHPAFLLRLTDPDEKKLQWLAFLSDMTAAIRKLRELTTDASRSGAA